MLLLLPAMICLYGCGGESSETRAPSKESAPKAAQEKQEEPKAQANEEAKDKYTVCLLPKLKGIAYFTSCAEGAKKAAADLGDIDLIYDGPVDGSAEKQASMIEKWTLQEVDVICVSPNAPDVVARAMKEAREAGIKVITWDADATPDSRSFFVNQATAQAIGYGLVDTMVNDLKEIGVEGGELAIVSASATAANQNSWIEHMKTRLEKYPEFTLATIKYPGESQNKALQDSQDLINAFPELKGIIGISSVSFPGAAEAVKQLGKAGGVLVTGLSTPNDMKGYVKEGVVKSVVLWNTEDLGYLTVCTAEALASGKLEPGATSLDAGAIGEKKIEGDQVLLGDILVFNKDNIDQYDF
ncbi:substrate-binding domain-containing protein [Candidatus Sumerlaeota bacterium]|nr:substrate-binding domain-containing protein [Candidatus Sumerlaeota bacterium]